MSRKVNYYPGNNPRMTLKKDGHAAAGEM